MSVWISHDLRRRIADRQEYIPRYRSEDGKEPYHHATTSERCPHQCHIYAPKNIVRMTMSKRLSLTLVFS